MKSWPRPERWESADAACPEGLDGVAERPEGVEGSLDILNLLSHPLELRLGVDDQLRHAESVGLRSDGIDLAVHFLQQEVELAAARFGRLDQHRPMAQMRPEPRDLF